MRRDVKNVLVYVCCDRVWATLMVNTMNCTGVEYAAKQTSDMIFAKIINVTTKPNILYECFINM